VPVSQKGLTTLLAAASILFAACGKRHETTELYVLVSANTGIAYWQEAAAGLERAARELGVRSELAGPAKYDPQAQKEELLRIIRRNPPPAGILVSAADPELMREPIDSAIGAGIPVITIDADSPKSKRLFFVGTNNYEAGQTGGEILVRELKGKGSVVVYSIPGQENLDERVEGYKRVLARHPGITITEVLNIGGDPAKAYDSTKALLDRKDQKAPDAFVCVEALSCSEVADVLDRAKIKDKIIIAMDTNQETLEWIEKGAIRATIAQRPYTMAYFGLRLADDFHHHKPPAWNPAVFQGSRAPVPQLIDTGAVVVDKSNLKAFTSSGPSAP
jgi:ribose transport system substrate-binding protein